MSEVKEKSTVWVTKYALSQGVLEKTGEITTLISGRRAFEYSCIWCMPGQWHKTKEEAIARAEEMRKAKIASLKKQIEKLENMRFE